MARDGSRGGGSRESARGAGVGAAGASCGCLSDLPRAVRKGDTRVAARVGERLKHIHSKPPAPEHGPAVVVWSVPPGPRRRAVAPECATAPGPFGRRAPWSSLSVPWAHCICTGTIHSLNAHFICACQMVLCPQALPPSSCLSAQWPRCSRARRPPPPTTWT